MGKKLMKFAKLRNGGGVQPGLRIPGHQDFEPGLREKKPGPKK